MGWKISYGHKRPKTHSAPAGPAAGFLFVLIGLAMLGGSAWTGMKTYALVSRGLHTEGTISNVEKSTRVTTRDRNGHHETSVETSYKYTVDFTDEKGTAVSFTDNTSDSGGGYDKGDKVGVIYLVNNPKGSAIIDQGIFNWMLPGILGLLGVCAVAAGGATVLRGKPGQQHPGSGPDQYKAG
jgi:hypothetical protein